MRFRSIFIYLSYFFAVLFFTEIMSFIFLSSKNDSTFPNYNFGKRTHYVDIDEIFGAWHIPNTKFNHVKSCFSVKYSFNSIGARDDNFNNEGKDRIFILGDSYAEGYGLSNEYKIDALLEKSLNVEALNFGTSGHFGTTQARLLYEKFENDFEHEIVLQIITVANDFEDDDYNYGSNYVGTKSRYRPYLINKDDNSYEVIYTNKDKFNKKKESLSVKEILSNYTNFYHFLKYLKSLYVSKQREDIVKKSINYYEDYDSELFDIFKYNFTKINDIAKNKGRVYIIVLAPDFQHLKYNIDKNFTTLSKELKTFTSKNGIGLIDLMNEISENNIDIQKIFYNNDNYDCDGHPNNHGSTIFNQFIANYIERLNVLRN